ncbi:MAG: hypothetical protein R2705_03615 [Ilumatobacteraceae bacterium]
MSGFRYGERVLLLDNKKRRYRDPRRGELHSHAGFVPHADFLDKGEAFEVRSSRNAGTS